MAIHSFAVIGGDKRNFALSEMLHRAGHKVKIYGFANYERETPIQCMNLSEIISDAEYIIGPTPCSHNDGDLNAPYHPAAIYAEDVFKLVKPSQIFLAGFIKQEIVNLAEKYGARIIDILKREELLIKNAIPTAEGAIKIAIEETDITIHGSRMLVIGYGRIGKILCSMLRGMGANVTAVVNSSAAAAAAHSQGCMTIHYRLMEEELSKADIIFNTVPEILLDKRNMGHIRNDSTLIIDLASPPYGVDLNDSRLFGLRVLYAGSLPGKIAAVTTAGYMLDTINQIIDEQERKPKTLTETGGDPHG